jgi:hypothetical protein
MRKLLYAITLASFAAVGLLAQQSGGAFVPSFDYTLSGNNTFSGTTTFTGATSFSTAPTLTGNLAPVGTITSADATTPILATATGKTNTGYLSLTGKTSGSFKILPADATAQVVTMAITAQTSGASTVTIPDMAGSNGTFSFVGKTETLAGKTLTTPIITSISNTGTVTVPNATGAMPVVLYCGSTGSGNQSCSPAAAAATTKIYAGHSTLASNAAVITFSPAFASTTYDCVANDITTRANVVQMLSTSNSTATITNTTGASDVINWICVGQ